MGICINPDCLTPNYPHDPAHRYCQSCGSDLLLVGRYRVTSLLSDNSGFGTIYEADEQNIPKILKVLKKQLNHQPKAVELFQQEVEVLQQLDHPGIPKVDGYFQYQTKHNLSLHCFVMEKIDGLNLEQWLELRLNQPIDEKTAIKWLKQVTEILDKVHQKDYFHRDIKPSNIMVRGNGQLVLIDFGTAREITGTYLAKVSRKKEEVTGIITPGYTPLEQANGQALPQSDFFALGRTWVFLVTGESPNFMKINPHTGELIWQDQAKHISPQLIDLINYLMAPFPGQRPKNAQEILSRLTEIEQKNKTLYQSKSLSSTRINLPQKPKNIQPKTVPPTVIQGKKEYYKLSIKWLIGSIFILVLVLINEAEFWRIQFASILVFFDKNFYHQYLIKQIYVGYLITDLKISPDGKALVGSNGDLVTIWAIPDGTILNQLPLRWKSSNTNNDSNNNRTNFFSKISSDAKIIAAIDDTIINAYTTIRTIKIWDVSTGKIIKTFTDNVKFNFPIIYSPPRVAFAISSDDKIITFDVMEKIKLLNIDNWKEINTIFYSDTSHYYHELNGFAINPDGKTIITGGDSTIKIWDISTGKLLNIIDNHQHVSFSFALTPDGKTLAVGNYSNPTVSDFFPAVKLWDVYTGKLLNTLESNDQIYNIAISADGNTLIGLSHRKTIKVWNLITKKIMYSIENRTFPCAVAISTDGKTIAVSGEDAINIYRLP